MRPVSENTLPGSTLTSCDHFVNPTNLTVLRILESHSHADALDLDQMTFGSISSKQSAYTTHPDRYVD